MTRGRGRGEIALRRKEIQDRPGLHKVGSLPGGQGREIDDLQRPIRHNVNLLCAGNRCHQRIPDGMSQSNPGRSIGSLILFRGAAKRIAFAIDLRTPRFHLRVDSFRTAQRKRRGW